MQTEYVIQTRQRGMWRRHIGSPERAAADVAWSNATVHRCAARLVETVDGKVVKVLATRKARPHDSRSGNYHLDITRKRTVLAGFDRPVLGGTHG